MQQSHLARRPNTALDLTPQSGDKIEAFLKSGISPTVFPIYWSGAAQRQAVGPPGSNTYGAMEDRSTWFRKV
jgi:hypothetical protein